MLRADVSRREALNERKLRLAPELPNDFCVVHEGLDDAEPKHGSRISTYTLLHYAFSPVLAIHAPPKERQHEQAIASSAASGLPVHFPPLAEVSEVWADPVRESVRAACMADTHPRVTAEGRTAWCCPPI